VTNSLLLAVSRICTQLRREGYHVQHERVEDIHIISAYEPGGRAVAQYVGCPTEDGFCIEELRD
jgi:hypothetical protein